MTSMAYGVRFLIGFLLVVVCGCIPVRTPPQLAYTPGAPVVVTDETVEFNGIRIPYPPGWRVLTPAASSPPQVIFAAPGADALLLIATQPDVQPPPLPGIPPDQQQTSMERVAFDGHTLWVWLVSHIDQHQGYLDMIPQLFPN